MTPIFPDDPESEGKGLLLVDLLSLRKTFSFRRYREDLVGFLAAWVVVAAMLLFAWACVRVGG